MLELFHAEVIHIRESKTRKHKGENGVIYLLCQFHDFN